MYFFSSYRGFRIFVDPQAGEMYKAFVGEVLKFETSNLEDIFDAIDSYRS